MNDFSAKNPSSQTSDFSQKNHAPQSDFSQKNRSPSNRLPGELMMWILILSELAVFGAGLTAFLALRITDPTGFAEAQSHLHRTGAGINTLILITSGWLAALATRAAEANQTRRLRSLLALAIALGAVFLALKASEFIDLSAQGITFETHTFFTFSYMLTIFHAAHVLAGMILLALVAKLKTPATVETGAAFWHMVDLIWVILFPVIYLL